MVLAQSAGTQVALALALRSPSAVKGLVFVAGYYFPTSRRAVRPMSWMAAPVIGVIMRYTIAPILGWLMWPWASRKLFAPRKVPDRFMAEFPLSLALRPKHMRATAEESVLIILAAARLQMRHKALRCPIAVFHGDGDQCVEFEQASRFHDVVPHSTLHIVRDGGHLLHYAVPEDIAAAVDRMVAPVSSSAGGASPTLQGYPPERAAATGRTL